MSYKDIVQAKSFSEFKAGFKKGGNKTAEENQIEQAPVDKNIVYVPELPRVNVIPSSVFEKYQVKGIARKFAFVGIAIAAVFILAYGGSLAYMGINQAKIDALSAEQASLTAEVNTLQPYDLYKVGIEGKRELLYQSVTNDINMGGIYNNINSAAQSNQVSMTSVTVRQYAAGDEGSECVNPDPFGDNAGVIGCIQLNGSAPNKDAVNGFISTLEGQDKATASYKDPFISSFSTEEDETGGQKSTFVATIGFTKELYTKQYANLAITLDELIANSDSSQADVTDESNDVQANALPDAGYAATETLALVPTLTAEEGRSIDGIAVTICNSSDDERDAAIEEGTTAINSLLTENHDDYDAETSTPTLITAITNNCPAVLETSSTQEEN